MPLHWGEFSHENESSAANYLSRADFLLSSYDISLTGSVDLPQNLQRRDPSEPPCRVETNFKKGCVFHTAQLVQYLEQLEAMIDAAMQACNKSLSDGTPVSNLPEAPSVPDCVGCLSLKPKRGPYTADLIDSDFVRGIGLAPGQINYKTCRSLLQHSVGLFTLHAGFQASRTSALEAFTDAVEVFVEKFVSQLRHNVDAEALGGHSGFQDAVHRTMTELGVGNSAQLMQEYRETIIAKHDTMLARCRSLLEVYNTIRFTGLVPDEVTARASSVQPFSPVYRLSDDESDVSEADLDDDDAEKLLELAGMSGFDIKIESADEATSDTEELPPVKTPATTKPEKDGPKPSKRKKR